MSKSESENNYEQFYDSECYISGCQKKAVRFWTIGVRGNIKGICEEHAKKKMEDSYQRAKERKQRLLDLQSQLDSGGSVNCKCSAHGCKDEMVFHHGDALPIKDGSIYCQKHLEQKRKKKRDKEKERLKKVKDSRKKVGVIIDDILKKYPTCRKMIIRPGQKQTFCGRPAVHVINHGHPFPTSRCSECYAHDIVIKKNKQAEGYKKFWNKIKNTRNLPDDEILKLKPKCNRIVLKGEEALKKYGRKRVFCGNKTTDVIRLPNGKLYTRCSCCAEETKTQYYEKRKIYKKAYIDVRENNIVQMAQVLFPSLTRANLSEPVVREAFFNLLREHRVIESVEYPITDPEAHNRNPFRVDQTIPDIEVAIEWKNSTLTCDHVTLEKQLRDYSRLLKIDGKEHYDIWTVSIDGSLGMALSVFLKRFRDRLDVYYKAGKLPKMDPAIFNKLDEMIEELSQIQNVSFPFIGIAKATELGLC